MRNTQKWRAAWTAWRPPESGISCGRCSPALEGKTVLDLGCGYGWHCRYAAEQGAKAVLGIDLSEKMLESAAWRTRSAAVTYRLCGIEDYEYPENTWDCVISNLALHYIADLDTIFRKIYKTLKPGGTLLFNIEHPSFTAGVDQDWIYSEDGKNTLLADRSVFHAGRAGHKFPRLHRKKQHHTLQQILMGVLNSGFTLKAVEEAVPPEGLMDVPGMEDELRRPMMLLVKAEK